MNPNVPFVVIGCDFRRASTKIRQAAVLADDEITPFFAALSRQGVTGFAQLATCNRVAWIVTCDNPSWASQLMDVAWRDRLGRQGMNLRPDVVVGSEALNLLLRISVGLESLIVGEREIGGQMRRCLRQAQEQGRSSPALNILASCQGRLASKARQAGALSATSRGMHSLVIDHLKGEVKDRPVAVVGMGEIGRKTAKALVQSGWRVDRYNRTADRERGWLALSELQPRLAGYGSLVVCSSAPEPVIHAAMVQEVSGLTLIDLGSPSQVSSAVIGAPGIDYLGLDEMAETAPQRLQNDRFETLKVLVAAAAQDSVEQLAQNRFRTLTHRNQTQLQEIFDTELPAVLDHFVAELPDKKRRDFEHQLRRLFRQHASGLRHAIVALDAELGPPTLRLAEDQDESC